MDINLLEFFVRVRHVVLAHPVYAGLGTTLSMVCDPGELFNFVEASEWNHVDGRSESPCSTVSSDDYSLGPSSLGFPATFRPVHRCMGSPSPPFCPYPIQILYRKSQSGLGGVVRLFTSMQRLWMSFYSLEGNARCLRGVLQVIWYWAGATLQLAVSYSPGIWSARPNCAFPLFRKLLSNLWGGSSIFLRMRRELWSGFSAGILA